MLCMEKPQWSEGELEILREHYNKATREDFKKLLPNRTWRAITDKAKASHLYRYRKYPRWGYPTDYKLIKLNMTPEQKAYIACAIDGEGSILILSTHYGAKYSPIVTITNCDKKFIDFIQKTIGIGKIYHQRAKKPRRPQWRLHIGTHLEVLSLLMAIKAFFVSKKQLASLMIRYCKSRLDRGSLPGRNIIYTQEEVKIAEKIRSLNDLSHRGDYKRKIKRNMC